MRKVLKKFEKNVNISEGGFCLENGIEQGAKRESKLVEQKANMELI